MAEVSLDLIQTMVPRVLDKLTQHDARFSRLEEQLAVQGKLALALRRDGVADAEVTSLVNDRVSALSSRIDRIESRLDLRDA